MRTVMVALAAALVAFARGLALSLLRPARTGYCADGVTAEGATLEVNTGTDQSPTWTPVVERAQLANRKTGESIDMTTFDDEGFRGRRPGLRSFDLEARGNYVPSDSGYQALESAWLDGELVSLRALWQDGAGGQVGWTVSAVITDIGESGDVGDKVETTLSFEGNGKPTKVEIAAS